jgi:F0F1-type ATP synthase assembly protein I
MSPSPPPTGSPPPDKRRKSGFRPPARDFLHDPLQTGVTIVAITAAFGGAGWWLDSKLGTFPVLMAVGATLGLFGALYSIYQRLKERESGGDGDSVNEDHQPPHSGA